MKRILTTIAAVLIMGSLSFAQDAKPTAKKKMPAKEAPAKKATKMKKDGTPDMRYKENKAMKKDAKPMKKAKAASTAK